MHRLQLFTPLLAAAVGLAGCVDPVSSRPRPSAPRQASPLPRPTGNHLRGERSLYLRQHADNPVNWYPWGAAALDRARRDDRPIFLSIGYASCHWCHVMEREVFEKEEVAALLNKHFVAIKVDREERPDLDAVYMTAVQAMTGSGGWPMSVFLTPSAEPFHGGTYFPRQAFMRLLRQINELYRTRRKDVDRVAQELTRRLKRLGQPGARATVDGGVMMAAAAAETAAAWDPQWGGLRGRMKFPQPLRWSALLRLYRRTGAPRWAKLVRKTLDAMASGGIHDHLAGGFHRYATDPTWTVPHFEKMLYDNALLALLYLDAAAAFGRAGGAGRYEQVARSTLDFLASRMSDQERGGFYASIDADSGGREGHFYTWTPAEIAAVAGPRDAPVLSELLGVSGTGQVDGRSVLTRRADTGQRVALLQRWKGPLLAARRLRPQPALDRKIITSWNGLAIAAFARGYAQLGEVRYRRAAERAAAYLWRHHRRPDGALVRASTPGGIAPRGAAILDDYASLAYALTELHQATGEPQHLRRAAALAKTAAARFSDATKSCFHLTPKAHPAPLGRKVALYDNPRPSGNASMLQLLLRLGHLTLREADLRRVDRCLSAFSSQLKDNGLEMAWWHDAALLRAGPYYTVVVAGDADSAGTLRLVETFRQLAPGHALLVTVPARGPDKATAALLPGTVGKTALGGRPTAFVCTFGTCKRPTASAKTLKTQLLSGWNR